MYQFSCEILDKAMSYPAFIEYTQSVINIPPDKAPYLNPEIISYTEANLRRRKKIADTLQLEKKLYNELYEGIGNWTWVLLDEPWCGDSSFIAPYIYAMSLASAGDIELKILLRDTYPEIMEQYLSNNGKAIPKLICLDKGLNELGTWGPRPEKLQHLVKDWVQEGIDMNEKIKRVYRWYKADNGNEIQKEFLINIRNWKKQ
jgi:hypothetical protein